MNRHHLGVVELCLRLHAECDEAEDGDEDAVDHQLPDGGPDVDLLVHVDGRHLPGAPHAPDQVGEAVPAAPGRLPALLLQQRELVIARLASDDIGDKR